MLNELWELHRAMTGAGIAMVEDESGFIQTPSSGPALRVYLTKNGSVEDEDLEMLKDGAASYVTCGKSKAQRFPIVNLVGIWRVSAKQFQTLKDWQGEKAKTLKAGKKCPAIPDFISKLKPKDRIPPPAWKASDLRNLEGALHRVSKQVCDPTTDSNPPQAMKELVERAQRIERPRDFLSQLGKAVLSKVRSGAPGWATLDDPIPQILFANFGRKVPAQFEPSGSYPVPAYDKSVREWIGAKFDKQAAATHGDSITDAFGIPATTEEIGHKFEEVLTETLKNISLMAKNTTETRALKRYGLGGPESFPVGSQSRSKLKRALKTVLQPEWKNKTWKPVVLSGSGKEQKWGTVVAYPTRFPKQPDYLAVTLVGNEDDRKARDFAAYAEKVTRSLKGLVEKDKADGKSTEVIVFVLSKISSRGTLAEVVLSERMTATHFIRSAEMWQEGAKNRPALLIKVRPQAKAKGYRRGKDEAKEWLPPQMPFPNEAFECLNARWIGMGKRHQEVKRYGMAESLRLLLSDGASLDQRFLGEMLSQAVRSSEALLLGAGQAFARDQRLDEITKTVADAERYLRLWPSILGILLHKLNHQKGSYMQNTAFLVGQLLSRVDTLHYFYCEVVRKSQVPPQLIGNAIMATALHQPQKAMAFLGKRILPYQAWARIYSARGDNEKIKSQLVQVIKEIGEITVKLATRYASGGETKPERIGESAREPASHVLDAAAHFEREATEAAQAQMMLGYLSNPEKAQMLLGYLDASKAVQLSNETHPQPHKTE